MANHDITIVKHAIWFLNFFLKDRIWLSSHYQKKTIAKTIHLYIRTLSSFLFKI